MLAKETAVRQPGPPDDRDWKHQVKKLQFSFLWEDNAVSRP